MSDRSPRPNVDAAIAKLDDLLMFDSDEREQVAAIVYELHKESRLDNTWYIELRKIADAIGPDDPADESLVAAYRRRIADAEERGRTQAVQASADVEPARPNHLMWNGTEWVDDRCGCRYHPDDDNGSHGGAPHVHRCDWHSEPPVPEPREQHEASDPMLRVAGAPAVAHRNEQNHDDEQRPCGCGITAGVGDTIFRKYKAVRVKPNGDVVDQDGHVHKHGTYAVLWIDPRNR